MSVLESGGAAGAPGEVPAEADPTDEAVGGADPVLPCEPGTGLDAGAGANRARKARSAAASRESKGESVRGVMRPQDKCYAAHYKQC